MRLRSSSFIVILTFLSITTFSGRCYAVVYGYIPNSADSNLSVINTEDGTTDPTPILVGTNPYGVATAPAGDYVYVTNKAAGTLSQIETQTGLEIIKHTIGANPVGVAVSPDGLFVYIAQENGSLAVLNTTDNGVAPYNVGTSLFGVAVSPDGNFIYVTDTTADTEVDKILMINTADFNDVTPIELKIGSKPKGIAVTPSGLYVVVANSGDDTVSLITTATNEVSATIDIAPPVEPFVLTYSPFGVAITNDSLFAYVTNKLDDSVSKISILTSSAAPPIPLTLVTDPPSTSGSPWGIAMHPYGSFVYVIDNTLSLVKFIATGKDTLSENTSGLLNTFSVGASPVGLGKFLSPELPPSDLTADLNGETGIDLKWTDNAVSETGYKIERKKYIGGGYVEIAKVGANEITYSDKNLDFYASYYYRVRAYNITYDVTGHTNYSNEATAQTVREDYSGCFIATAAYGSLLDPQVSLLRKFRDQYLAINQPGRAFLDMYYEYSPPIAKYIANHNFCRFLVRWSLLPLVAMSWLSLTIGLLPTMLVLSSLCGLATFIVLKRKQALAGQ
ncbi:MAG: CFI-box-CTERM domain-containing protein [Thermodesulfobacteriota bacterium]